MVQKLFYYCLLFLVFAFLVNSNAQVDPGTENLKHSWTFNDGTPNDYVGGANGTLKGFAGIMDGSLLTVEVHSWLELPAAQISLNSFDEVTLETWFIPVEGGNTGYSMLAWFGRTVNALGVDGYFITAARGNDVSRTAISCGVEASPWTGETGVDGTEYDDGELHHMVSTLTSSEIALYIDGQFIGSAELAANNSIAAISSENAYLAKGGYDGDSTWTGEILEFSIFNKALSADEVLFLFNKGAVPTAVENNRNITPDRFKLLQNYPNPFNPSTRISFDLPEQSAVKIRIYDMLGTEVAVVLDEIKPAGSYNVEFNAAGLSSGTYIYRMEANNNIISRTMLLLK